MVFMVNVPDPTVDPVIKKQPPLIIILGATAVGKTDLSLKLAQHFKGEIVSGDSRLIYRGMDIGTAKPTPEEMARAPHHLVDVTDLDNPWSLAVFQKAVQEAISEIHAHGGLPILVGGTGQYIRAIIEGWEIPAVTPNLAMRNVLETWAREIGVEELHKRLASLDPMAAAQIESHNLRRTVRALEVILSTGKPFSAQRQRQTPRYRILKIGLYRPREELYQRVDARLDAMIDAGLIDEVKKLLDQGYSPDLPGFSAIGYGDLVAYLQGKISLDEAITLIKRRTRVFVRHQANWFKMDDPTIHWFRVEDAFETEVEITIRKWLAEDEG
jgi:tRNA dimethylallyltransferase